MGTEDEAPKARRRTPESGQLEQLLRPIDGKELVTRLQQLDELAAEEMPREPRRHVSSVLQRVVDFDQTSFNGLRSTDYAEVQQIFASIGERILAHPTAGAHIREQLAQIDQAQRSSSFIP